MSMKGVRTAILCPRHMADAILNQATPTQNYYDVLVTTPFVRILSLEALVTWTVAVTGLDILVTIDGVAIRHHVDNPVSGTSYFALFAAGALADGQPLTTDNFEIDRRAFLYEGRSVRVQVRRTGGTADPLHCHVKYARW